MKPYVVRQGDYLKKLAFARGFDADEVWDDPKNAEIKNKRKDPNLLHPGDLIHLPTAKREGLSLQKGTTNSYTAKLPRVEVQLRLSQEDGPLANEPYELLGLGAPVQGTTGSDGAVQFLAPVTAREVELRLLKRGTVHMLRLGDMDPIDEASGVWKRLAQLGYDPGTPPGEPGATEEALADALRAFQADRGIEPTGRLDEATRRELVEQYGC
jgi:hypothetical protein